MEEQPTKVLMPVYFVDADDNMVYGFLFISEIGAYLTRDPRLDKGKNIVYPYFADSLKERAKTLQIFDTLVNYKDWNGGDFFSLPLPLDRGIHSN